MWNVKTIRRHCGARAATFGLPVLLVCSTTISATQASQLEPAESKNVVRQGFPAAKADGNDLSKSDTAWDVQWDLTSKDNNEKSKGMGSVFRIVSAKFMFKDRTNQPKWVQVAGNIHLAEAFAPYDDMQTAFLDVAGFPDRPFKTLPAKKEFLGPNCVLPGEILDSENPYFKNKVYREVHDDGLRWMTGFGPPNRARRGEKLMLWSVFQAANYVYIQEYQFTDDGRIVCRIAPTGYNFYNRGGEKGAKDGDVHLHVACWRIDFDLGNPATNSYSLMRRAFENGTRRFRVIRELIDNEVSRQWKAEEFTTLRVESSTLKNSDGLPVAYDLIPTRLGSVRDLKQTGQLAAPHVRADMTFANNDFWFTATPKQSIAYHELPKIVGNRRRRLAGNAVTVWYSSPAIHEPRAEDFGPSSDPRPHRSGVALSTWIEFTLRPRDLFDTTPLFEPLPRKADQKAS